MGNPDYVPADFLLELDGRRAGRLLGADGGGGRTSVVDDAIGGQVHRVKHLSPVEIEPMTLYCGTGMSHAFYDWIGSTFNKSGNRRKSGVVVSLDKDLKATLEREFSDAIVVEVVLPDLDASKKDDAALKVKIKPEYLRHKVVNGGNLDLGVYRSRTTKAWHVNSFRLKIDGLPRDSQNVTKIRGIQVKQGFKAVYTGSDRHPQIEPTKVEFPNLVIEVPAAYVDGYKKWYEASAKDKAKATRKGSLDYLGPDSGSSYFGLDLTGVGIVSFTQRSGQPAQIELFCERMSFHAGPAAVK